MQTVVWIKAMTFGNQPAGVNLPGGGGKQMSLLSPLVSQLRHKNGSTHGEVHVERRSGEPNGRFQHHTLFPLLLVRGKLSTH